MNITHELKLKAETVFNAVSTEKGIQGWWSKNSNVGETVGSNSLLQFVKEGMEIDMQFETKVLEKDKKVIWECTAMPNPAWIGTKIITEINETPKGCDIVFSHADFDKKWQGQDPFEQTKATWNHFVQSLKDYCEKGQGQPW